MTFWDYLLAVVYSGKGLVTRLMHHACGLRCGTISSPGSTELDFTALGIAWLYSISFLTKPLSIHCSHTYSLKHLL